MARAPTVGGAKPVKPGREVTKGVKFMPNGDTAYS